ncbi:hypothetical protein PHLGIDRAFT_125075 [Phlebiopsis gigantea 11061_1 CR5-6]|uniref:DUF6533 domain-containing protein n=1 Tax=Phlebiopsis gigantea (strain 11061_1 CR5-6) TaxID=745531 RepID=A0A0C3P0B9_PHLG1|nr:hypothetical protein PHLGIDRAFT_125075 [Phlebiopsis gigantea 11061_1 CR5-6]
MSDTHVAAQYLTTTVAARDSVSGFPYIDFDDRRVSQSAAFSRLTLLAYDIILNAPREKELIWDQRWRVSTAIYFVIRYPVLAFQIFNVYITSGHETAQYVAFFIVTCRGLDFLIASSASFALRVYAVMGLSQWGVTWAVCLIVVGASTIAFDIWQAIQVSCSTASTPICKKYENPLLSRLMTPPHPATVLTFFSMAVFDILATAILFVRAIKLFRESGWQLLRSSRLVALIVHQGVVYFIAVSIVQVAAIVLYFFPQNMFGLILNNLPLFISSILLSRFLLDLREHHLYPSRSMTHDIISMTTMHFGSSRGDTFSSTSDETSRGWASSIIRDFDDPDDIIFSSDENFFNTYWSDETDLTW